MHNLRIGWGHLLHLPRSERDVPRLLPGAPRKRPLVSPNLPGLPPKSPHAPRKLRRVPGKSPRPPRKRCGRRGGRRGTTFWWGERPRELFFIFKFGSPGVSPHRTNLCAGRGSRFLGARSAGEPAFDGIDERVIRAAAVVGLGEGIDIEEFRVEVGLQGDHRVRNILIERGDGRHDGRKRREQRAVLGKFGSVKRGGQRFGMLRDEVESRLDDALPAGTGVLQIASLRGGEIEQERQVRADGGDGGVDVRDSGFRERGTDVIFAHTYWSCVFDSETQSHDVRHEILQGYEKLIRQDAEKIKKFLSIEDLPSRAC